MLTMTRSAGSTSAASTGPSRKASSPARNGFSAVWPAIPIGKSPTLDRCRNNGCSSSAAAISRRTPHDDGPILVSFLTAWRRRANPLSPSERHGSGDRRRPVTQPVEPVAAAVGGMRAAVGAAPAGASRVMQHRALGAPPPAGLDLGVVRGADHHIVGPRAVNRMRAVRRRTPVAAAACAVQRAALAAPGPAALDIGVGRLVERDQIVGAGRAAAFLMEGTIGRALLGAR